MEIKYTYSKIQLEKAIKFIGENNKSFLGKFEIIRNSIFESINRLLDSYPKYYFAGTMGFFITVDTLASESIDSDENSVMIEIMIDPALGADHNADDFIENILHK